MGRLWRGVCLCEELVGVTWRESDCEELVGVTHRRWWGWFSPKKTI